jgi:hypothetical protein
MTELLQIFKRIIYPKPQEEMNKLKSLYGSSKPLVLSSDSGEIGKKEIDIMTEAWEESVINIPEDVDNFWLSCSYSKDKDLAGEDYRSYINFSDYKRAHSCGEMPKTVKLLEMAKQMLTDLNIPFSDKDHLIEFHHTKVSPGGISKPKFDWHIDDNGAVEYKTVAVLFYVHKDLRMIGGNLFWNPYGEQEEGKKLINIRTGTTIIMPGNTSHCPEMACHHFSSKDNEPQERKLIVFFFRDTVRG